MRTLVPYADILAPYTETLAPFGPTAVENASLEVGTLLEYLRFTYPYMASGGVYKVDTSIPFLDNLPSMGYLITPIVVDDLWGRTPLMLRRIRKGHKVPRMAIFSDRKS
ncbi:hypothetical protein KY284_030226 [Solanum tuberosum]|nr:hypothetical protein KY284_030226 [Solanum tuberosum]